PPAPARESARNPARTSPAPCPHRPACRLGCSPRRADAFWLRHAGRCGQGAGDVRAGFRADSRAGAGG
ncbi:hypothetical protein XarbCFBP8150_21670, partial [Xanthomonas arboricola]